MQIQVNTDNHTEGSARLTEYITTVVGQTLDRFRDRVTRIEVHMADQNSSHKSGADDKTCRIEARIAGMQPISVSDEGPTNDVVLKGAVEKLQRSLQKIFDKRNETKGRVSFAGEQEK